MITTNYKRSSFGLWNSLFVKTDIVRVENVGREFLIFGVPIAVSDAYSLACHGQLIPSIFHTGYLFRFGIA